MSFFGYNFFKDISTIEPAFGEPTLLDDMKIFNAIYTNLNIMSGQRDISSGDIPVGWDGYTLFSCDFTTLNGGNVNWQVENISKILVKRRVHGESNWIIMAEIIISTEEDLNFVHHDYYNASGVVYDYALVNVDLLGNEQIYNIGTINSVFNKTFITDGKAAYDLTRALNYEGVSRNQEVGVYQTLGKKYPVIVKNSSLNYTTMTTSAYLIWSAKANGAFSQTIDRGAEITHRNAFLDFLLNNKAKILKDYNGNIWLIGIIESPNVQYLQELGNGVAKVSFNWTELGDAYNEADMENARLIPVSPIYSQTI